MEPPRAYSFENEHYQPSDTALGLNPESLGSRPGLRRGLR